LIENLKDLVELGSNCQKITPMSRAIDDVNIVNAHCIEANLKILDNKEGTKKT
jgi:hypothetical protein